MAGTQVVGTQLEVKENNYVALHAVKSPPGGFFILYFAEDPVLGSFPVMGTPITYGAASR